MRAIPAIPALLACCALAFGTASALGAEGEPDPSFGTGGIVLPVPAEWNGTLKALALAPGGKIDAVGVYHPKDEAEVLALRLTEAGALDPTFGSGGREVEYFIAHNPTTLASESGEAVVSEPDGSMIVGSTRVAGRLLPTGERDTAFKLGQVMEYEALAPLAGGSFLGAGWQENTEHMDFRLPAVDGFGPEGEPDTAFDNGAQLVIPVFAGTEWQGEALAAVPAEEGKTLIAGTATPLGSGSSGVAWVAPRRAERGARPELRLGRDLPNADRGLRRRRARAPAERAGRARR